MGTSKEMFGHSNQFSRKEIYLILPVRLNRPMIGAGIARYTMRKGAGATAYGGGGRQEPRRVDPGVRAARGRPLPHQPGPTNLARTSDSMFGS